MANVIIPKRSTVAGKVPATGDLVTGEIAINLTDKKLYSKDGSGAVIEIGGSASVDLLNVNSGISAPDYIQFDTGATNTPAVGKIYWDAGEGSFLYTLSGGNVTQNLHPGSELVYNGTGATLTKGQVVYLSGAQGHRPSVTLALATSESTSARTIGIVAESIANGAEGWIRTYGILEGFDTSSFTAGSQLYLSGTTAGAMTATKPVAPIHLVYTARVIKSHATAGRILVGIQNGYELDEIHDVAISAPSTGQTIVYNSTTSLWSNGTLPVAGGGTGATSLTSGYLVKGNGTSAASASVVYDDGTNVGIGTSSPTTKLMLAGSAGSNIYTRWSNGSQELYAGISSGNTALLGTLSNDPLLFYANSSERMRIDSTGKVGIGTSSPNRALTIGNSGVIGLYDTGNANQATLQMASGGLETYVGAKYIAFGTNATERMRINSSGDVGIGTSSPSAKFVVSNSGAFGYEVNPTGGVGGGATVATYNRSTMGYTSLTTYASTMTWYANGTRAMDLDVSGRFSVGNAGPLNTNMVSAYGANQNGFVAQVSNNVYSTFQGFNSTTTLTFQVDGSGNGYFAGNLGVGTSSPGAKLDVYSASPVNAVGARFGVNAGGYSVQNLSGIQFYWNLSNGFAESTIVYGNTTNSFLAIGKHNGTSYAETMRITSAGDVGIGTSSPGAKFHVDTGASTGTSLIVGAASATSSQINMGIGVVTAGRPFIGTNTNTNPLEIGTRNASALILLTDTTERARIDSAGNVGIGIASPNGILHARGNIIRFDKTGTAEPTIRFRSANDSYASEWGVGHRSSSNDFAIRWYDGSTGWFERFSITTAGNVGVGTASPDYKLSVAGTALRIGIVDSTAAENWANTDLGGFVFRTHYGLQERVGMYAVGNFSTGSYQPDLLFKTNATERLRIDYAGNVGIGTSSPTAYSGYTSLEIDNASNGGILSIKKAGSVVGYLNGASGLLLLAQSNDLKLTTTGSTSMQFSTNATERMRIDSSGNVGIGATPSAWSGLGSALQVQNASIVTSSAAAVDTYFSSNAYYNAGWKYVITGTATRYVQNAAGDHRWYTAGSGTAGNAISFTQAMTLDASGRLGIGTNASALVSKLVIEGTLGTTASQIQIVGTGVRSGYISPSSNGFEFGTDSGGLVFRTGVTGNASVTTGTERMRIDSNGYVGIGTSSPAFPLDVQATGVGSLIAARIYRSDGAISLLRIGNSTSGNDSSAPAYGSDTTAAVIYTNNTERLRINSAGNVGIGTTSPGSKLHVVGDINLDGISVRDTATTTTTATTQVALATFAGATYDSAEVIIKAKQGTAVHITKLLVVYDGTTASATEFGTVLSGSSLFTTDVDVSSGSVRVLITPASATSTVFKASYELITA